MYIFSRSTWLRRFTQTTSNGWRCRPDSSCRGVLKIRRSTTESTTPRSSFVPSSSTRSSGPSREPSRTNISKSRILRGRQSLTTPKIGNLKSATTSTSTLINVAHLLLFMHFDQNVLDQSINQISWSEDVLIFNLKYFIPFNIFNGPFLTSLHWVIHSGLEKK